MVRKLRDMYNGKLMGMQPRLARLEWIKENCRTMSGSPQYDDLWGQTNKAALTGEQFIRVCRMLAYPPKQGVASAVSMPKLEKEYQDLGALFSRQEYLAINTHQTLSIGR